MGAVAGREERFDALPLPFAGEYLDHPADGFRAIQAGAWPAHHLDALDQFQRQILQGRATGGHRADLDAVDHHQHMVGLSAAHIQRGGLARPAIVRQRNAGHLLQKLGQRARLTTLDSLAVDHRHCRQALPSGLRGARSGYHLLFKVERSGPMEKEKLPSST